MCSKKQNKKNDIFDQLSSQINILHFTLLNFILDDFFTYSIVMPCSIYNYPFIYSSFILFYFLKTF